MITSERKVKSMKVYVASCWWRDCDAFVSIAGRYKGTVSTAAQAAMDEAAREAEDSDDSRTADAYMDDICWSGIHIFDLQDVLSDHEIKQTGGDYEEFIAGNSDILYLPTH